MKELGRSGTSDGTCNPLAFPYRGDTDRTRTEILGLQFVMPFSPRADVQQSATQQLEAARHAMDALVRLVAAFGLEPRGR